MARSVVAVSYDLVSGSALGLQLFTNAVGLGVVLRLPHFKTKGDQVCERLLVYFRRPAFVADLGDHQGEVRCIVPHQVPAVRRELVLDLVDEARRPEEVKALLPSQADAQKPVEAREVVHVGVGDEGVADAKQLARRKRRQVAKVEQQRPPFEHELQIEPRIAEGIVDQPRVE